LDWRFDCLIWPGCLVYSLEIKIDRIFSLLAYFSSRFCLNKITSDERALFLELFSFNGFSQVLHKPSNNPNP
jgi:hypothetical protein